MKKASKISEKISANIPVPVFKRAKALAAIYGLTMSDLISTLLENAVNKNRSAIDDFQSAQNAAQKACSLDIPLNDPTTKPVVLHLPENLRGNAANVAL